MQSINSSSHNSLSVVDSSEIRLLNWNIYKGKKQFWSHDLRGLATDSNLVLIQEALLHEDFYSHFSGHESIHVAQGFYSKNVATGVLTASSAQALRSNALKHKEPFFRTQKSALVTEYRLSDLEQTLMVANIHSINFSLGTMAFRMQLKDIFSQLHDHPGPVLLAGDFNTWRAKRMRLLSDMARESGLQDVIFSEDARKQVFRNTLDHIFYRGLQCHQARVINVSTSDHNPILAEFSI